MPASFSQHRRRKVVTPSKTTHLAINSSSKIHYVIMITWFISLSIFLLDSWGQASLGQGASPPFQATDILSQLARGIIADCCHSLTGLHQTATSVEEYV